MNSTANTRNPFKRVQTIVEHVLTCFRYQATDSSVAANPSQYTPQVPRAELRFAHVLRLALARLAGSDGHDQV